MSRNAEHLDSETLSALIDEQGTAAARAMAVRHLAGCAECTARKAAFESAAKAVSGLARVAPTADETRAIRQAVLDARPGRLAWWPAAVHAGGRRLLAAGAAVAVVLAGAIWFGVASGGPTASSSAAKAPGHVAQSPQQPQAAGPLTVPAVNGAANPVPSAPGLAANASPFIYSGSESGGTLFVPPTPASFSSEAQVASYVAGQATVRDEANALTAGSASFTNRQFLNSIGGAGPESSAGGALPPSPTSPTPSPAASPTVGSTSATSSTGSTTNPAVSGVASDAGPVSPAPPLAQCVEQVVAYVPQPAAAIEAAPVTYRGTPAWLIVLATAPASAASPSASEALTTERFWVQSQAGCATLTQGTV